MDNLEQILLNATIFDILAVIVALVAIKIIEEIYK